jgi:hypothetical protein
MDQEEKEMSEEVFNGASMVLADQGRVTPVYLIVKDKLMNPVVGHPGITAQQLASSAVNIAHEINADAIVLVCEQWMVKMKKGTKEAQDYLDGTKRPSESPDAKSYLTLTYMEKTGEASSLIGKIHTSLNGVNFIRDSKWIDDTATNMITPWAINENNASKI